jgi:hypothetical protein
LFRGGFFLLRLRFVELFAIHSLRRLFVVLLASLDDLSKGGVVQVALAVHGRTLQHLVELESKKNSSY